MVFEEVKFNNNSVNAPNTNATSSAASAQNKSTAPNTVFEEFKKYAKKMGVELNDEELIQFFNSNPNFPTLSPEEQTTAFNKFLSEKNNVVVNNPESEQLQAESEIEETSVQNTEPPVANAESAEVSHTNIFVSSNTQVQPEETVPVEDIPTTEADISAEEDIDDSFLTKNKNTNEGTTDVRKQNIGGVQYDSRSFGKLSYEQMVEEYIYEYAKNKFVNEENEGNDNNEKWYKLSDKQRTELIAKNREEALAHIKNAKQLAAATDINIGENQNRAIMESLMMRLQASNEFGYTLNSFLKEPKIVQEQAIAEMVVSKKEFFSDKMSAAEELHLEVENFKREAVIFKLKQMGEIEDDAEPCYSEVYQYLGQDPGYVDKKINLAVAEQEMLEAKVKSGQKLSDIEQIAYEDYKDFNGNIELLHKRGSKNGLTSLRHELLERDDYRQATSVEEKLKIMSSYVSERYKDKPEELVRLYIDAYEHDDYLQKRGLLDLISKNEKAQEALSKAGYPDVQVLIAGTKRGTQALGKHITGFYANYSTSEAFSDKEKIELNKSLSANMDDEQYASLTGSDAINANPDEEAQTIITTGYYKRNDISDEKKLAITQNIHGNDAFCQEAKNANGLHIQELNAKDQNAAVQCVNAETADVMARSGNIHEFEDQSGVGVILQQKVETGLPEERAVAAVKAIADEVALFRKEHQLPMHESLSNSKYSEVAEYAAGNIYKYDASVQVQAASVSYEVAVKTGNNNIIAAVQQNYSKMAPEAQQAIANNEQLAQMLSVQTGKEIAKDEELSALIKNESAAGLGIPMNDKEKFLEKWNSMSSSEKYSFMCEISTKYFSKMSPDMRKKVLEHAKNDPVLMRRLVKTWGLDLLKTQLFPDALAVIVRELLHDPAERVTVAKEVCGQPNRYPDSLVETCQEIIAEREGIKVEDFNKLSGIEKKETLKDPNSINPKELAFSGQSGSNRSNLGHDFEPNEFKKQANLRSFHLIG